MDDIRMIRGWPDKPCPEVSAAARAPPRALAHRRRGHGRGPQATLYCAASNTDMETDTDTDDDADTDADADADAVLGNVNDSSAIGEATSVLPLRQAHSGILSRTCIGQASLDMTWRVLR